jgi:tripartite-type tricarboxylate transporter receptor subunit TctC
VLLRRRDFLYGAAGTAALPFLPRAASAQAYPSRSITMVVPVAAGGALDTNARLVAEGMRATLGQVVVIENVTGGGGSTGATRIARATPDGYNILYGANVTHVLNPAVLNVSYDPLTDFEPIALVGNTPWLFAVKNDLPVKNLQELIAWLKANPDKATFGTAGQGSPSHIGGVLFQNVTGTRFQFIPYRGTAPVVPDLVSGQIDMAILDPITSLPQHRAGKIRILAVMGKKRGSGSQDIPLGDESGAPGVYTEPWQGIWAPKGTPREIVMKLNEAVRHALTDPAARQKFADQSYELTPRENLTPEYFAQFIKADIEKWWPIIKAAGIKAGG